MAGGSVRARVLPRVGLPCACGVCDLSDDEDERGTGARGTAATCHTGAPVRPTRLEQTRDDATDESVELNTDENSFFSGRFEKSRKLEVVYRCNGIFDPCVGRMGGGVVPSER